MRKSRVRAWAATMDLVSFLSVSCCYQTMLKYANEHRHVHARMLVRLRRQLVVFDVTNLIWINRNEYFLFLMRDSNKTNRKKHKHILKFYCTTSFFYLLNDYKFKINIENYFLRWNMSIRKINRVNMSIMFTYMFVFLCMNNSKRDSVLNRGLIAHIFFILFVYVYMFKRKLFFIHKNKEDENQYLLHIIVSFSL